ncbi:MAG: hypothetical protein LIO85_04115 [Rikenellaceae bacterium]|nr:hypothetical protein [Rikenellaceae bacterium]
MALRGYQRQAGRRDGGITAIALADAAAVSLVAFDRATGNAERIETAEGEQFALYRFREDAARFTETATAEAGFLKVERELTFPLERLDANQRQAVTELLRRSHAGLVAVVYNGCGTAHLVGMSSTLGNAFPLRVRRSRLDSGQEPADMAAEMITLYNEDASKAPLFTGELTIDGKTIRADGTES